MRNLIFVSIGGAIGVSIRYYISIIIKSHSRIQFPLDTFLINFIGCFILGILITTKVLNTSSIYIKEFLVIGVLGGFTTFSTFSLETFEIIKSGNFNYNIIN